MATCCEELTHWKRPWCWERLRAGGERDDRGWDGWMASPTQWTWVWVNSGSWWWAGTPGMLQSMRLQWVRHDWATELNWTDMWLWGFLELLSSHFSFLSRGKAKIINWEYYNRSAGNLRIKEKVWSPSWVESTCTSEICYDCGQPSASSSTFSNWI